jgi:hypothetical protein
MLPLQFVVEDVCADLVTAFELARDDRQSRLCDVVSGAHGRISRSDERHEMTLVARVDLGVPDLGGMIKRAGLDDPELDGHGPRPTFHELEEASNYQRAGSVGIELGDTSDHDGPSDSSREADDVAVDGTATGPELDTTKRMTESLLLWHKTQDVVGDSGSVDGAQICFIQAA